MANTNILIKRSSVTTKPATLNAGELAYSYLSNTMFLGTAGGNGTLNVGGQIYTQTIDNASSANIGNTLVKRASDGSFAGQLFGTANSANTLVNAQNISINNGDVIAAAVSFNGSAPVVLSANLSNISGLTPAAYGSSTLIPIVTVAANGRIMAISTVTAAGGGSGSGVSNFNVTANSGGPSVFVTSNVSTNTLSFIGNGSGINTSISGNVVTIGSDTTVLRSNTILGPQVITSDLVISGNLTLLQSNVQSFNIFSTTIATGDSLIKLAANNNVADLIDIGFYGASNTGASLVYHGLIREGSGGPSSGNFYLFKNLATEPTGNITSYGSLTRANLIANIISGTVSGLAAPISVADGGTGNATYTANTLTYFNGVTQASLANLAISGVYGNNSYHPVITVDNYGRVIGVSNTIVSIDASAVITGLLPTTRGGIGVGTIAVNGVIYGNGTNAISVTAAAGVSDQAYTNQILTTTNAGTPIWASAVDGGVF